MTLDVKADVDVDSDQEEDERGTHTWTLSQDVHDYQHN